MGEALITRRGGSGSDVPVYEVDYAEVDNLFQRYGGKARLTQYIAKDCYLGLTAGGSSTVSYTMYISVDGGRTFTAIYNDSVTGAYVDNLNIGIARTKNRDLFYLFVTSEKDECKIYKISNLNKVEMMLRNTFNQYTTFKQDRNLIVVGENIYFTNHYHPDGYDQNNAIEVCSFNVSLKAITKLKEVSGKSEADFGLSKDLYDNTMCFFTKPHGSGDGIYEILNLNGTKKASWDVSNLQNILNETVAGTFNSKETKGLFCYPEGGFWLHTTDYMYNVDIRKKVLCGEIKMDNKEPFSRRHYYPNRSVMKFDARAKKAVVLYYNPYFSYDKYSTHFEIGYNENRCNLLAVKPDFVPEFSTNYHSGESVAVSENMFAVGDNYIFYLKEV